MYDIEYTGKFKKDMKLCAKRGWDMSKIRVAIELLHQNGALPDTYKPHHLSGDLSKYWECHIAPDWLLMYDVKETVKLVSLARTGTHSDLF